MRKNKRPIPNTDFLSDKNWLKYFLEFDISLLEKELRTKGEDFWQNLGEKKALKIFHLAALRVPAYKDFLKKRKIDHESIKNISDFKRVPLTDKKNYISVYPLSKRCWDGKLTDSRIMAVSSGTSGEPTFWPRSDYQEYEQNIIHELAFKYSFEVDKYKTLVIIAFPMGIYVSGMATALPAFISLSKKYKATFLTPGNNKAEVIRIVKALGGDFEQIVFVGHPFFIKDVIETGNRENIKWFSRNIRMMFCSEGFNETWRDYLLKEAGIKNNRFSAVNTYGSSEILLTATETPLSIFARNILDKKEELRKKIFNSEFVPNIFQYNPLLRYIESERGELVFTTAGQVPLIRFDIHDSGEVVSFDKVKEAIGKEFDIFRKNGKNPIWKLPFVSLYGRSDHTVIFYAANIYPEHIRIALDHKPFLDKITGKFTMCKRFREDMEQCLEINIELQPGVVPHQNFEEEIRYIVTDKLRKINKEYLDTSEHSDKDLRPNIILWPNGDEKYFKPGLKPKFIVK